MWPTSLRWRLFVLNALLIGAAVVALIVTPASVSTPATASEVGVLVVGTLALLALNLVVVRRSTAPLVHLTEAMADVDLLEPGYRMDVPGGDREIGALVTGFNAMLARLEDERRASANASLLALERDRTRIARELHDGVGQSLTAVLMAFDRLARGTSTDVAADATSGQELTRHALDEVRTIVDRLRPDPIEELGLAGALRSLADRVNRHAPQDVVATVGTLPALEPEAELAVYRVAQEALTNALRHADATQISLDARGGSGQLVLNVADDGRGLRAGERGEPGHGLRNMRERAVAIGALLDVGPAVAGGTCVSLRVPA
jgi:two-component system sensor histidine kinase UhpB